MTRTHSITGRGFSTRRRRAPALDKAERRALLLRCALQVFARRDLGAARHAEIAVHSPRFGDTVRAAGVSASPIHQSGGPLSHGRRN